VTVRFRIVLSVLGEKVKLCVFGGSTELNLSLLVKMWRKTVRFRQCTAFSEEKQNYIFSETTWSETWRFRRKRRVKRCIFGDNAVFTKIRLCRRIFTVTSEKI
jgi:hypothetical protein